MKKIIIILSLIFLYNCGYSSFYKNTKTNDLELRIISMTGDNGLNNQIKNYARLYSNINSENKYEINISSNYEKIILVKNSSGVATDYKIIATVNFTVNLNGKIENISYKEELKIEKNFDTFQQKEYENSLKRNFANSISKKLITRILRISDI